MLVSFFEEYPKKESLSKLNLVSWPCRLFLAARSLKEFKSIKSKIHNKNVKEFVYWPVLDKKEGYWITPFSESKALGRIFKEVKGRDVPVMLDAELPTSINPKLYLTQFPNFFHNKKLIQDFVRKHKNVYVSEYYPDGPLNEKILSLFGLHFDAGKFNTKVIKMVYHSMHRFDSRFITSEIMRGKNQFGKKFVVAYGTIAPGIMKNEPMLSCEQLERDLSIADKANVNEVVVYRLGGLNRKYCSVIENFL